MEKFAQYLETDSKETNESGSSFNSEVKFSIKDWNMWRLGTMKNKDIDVSHHSYDKLSTIWLDGTKHIATYDHKRNVLMVDKKNEQIFGN